MRHKAAVEKNAHRRQQIQDILNLSLKVNEKNKQVLKAQQTLARFQDTMNKQGTMLEGMCAMFDEVGRNCTNDLGNLKKMEKQLGNFSATLAGQVTMAQFAKSVAIQKPIVKNLTKLSGLASKIVELSRASEEEYGKIVWSSASLE